MKVIFALVSAILLFFWVMLGMGVGLGVVIDNEQGRDALFVGGIVGLIYTAVSVFAVWWAVLCWQDWFGKK